MNKLTSRLSNFPKILLFCLFVSLFIPPLSPLYSQIDTLWTRNYGGSSNDEGLCVLEARDGGYVLAGVTGDADVYVVRTDKNGNTLWEKSYGGDGWDGAYGVCEGHNGGFYVIGTYDYFALPSLSGIWLLRLDEDGDTLWTKVYFGTVEGYDIKPTRDGNYIIAGTYVYPGGYGLSDFYLLKVDSLGNILWSGIYGGLSKDEPYAIEETQDGGYIAVGRTASFGAGMYDFYLVRVDSVGDTLWTRTFGGYAWDYAYDVCPTSDGGFAVVGHAATFDPNQIWLVKVDSMGNHLWDRVFGYGWGTAYSVIETKDKGLMIAGFLYPGYLLVIRTDSLGNTLWDWTLGTPDREEGGRSIRQTKDGGFIIGGYCTYNGLGNQMWLVKTTPETNIEEREFVKPLKFSITPNPSNGIFDVFYSLGDLCDVRLDLFDIAGRKVREILNISSLKGEHRVRLDLRDLSSGLYFLRVRIGDKERIKKVLIMR